MLQVTEFNQNYDLNSRPTIDGIVVKCVKSSDDAQTVFSSFTQIDMQVTSAREKLQFSPDEEKWSSKV